MFHGTTTALRRWSTAVAACLLLNGALPIPAPAQTLLVRMTGQRMRLVQTRSLFHTLFHDFFPQDDGTMYVQTGDIPAMWLRDASAQTIPYVRFQAAFPALRTRFAGVIEREARAIAIDPYANAFQADFHVWERKWEPDSLAWPVLLLWVYVRSTGDRRVLTPSVHVALTDIVDTYACETHHSTCGRYRYPYRVATQERYDESLGLMWCGFRPSDDPVAYRFNIPENIIAAEALRDIAALAPLLHDDALAARARTLEAQLVRAVLAHGITYDEGARVWRYAYEIDGYGNALYADDANIPNLTTLPYLHWTSALDPAYLATRSAALGSANPWYYSGRYAQGLGSPHTPEHYVWPLGIIGRALTATSAQEVSESITTLAETDSEQGMIHESFYADGYWRYTRAEFGWANALFAELLFRTLAGDRAVPFVPGGEMLPFQVPTETPVTVPLAFQLKNEADIYGALDDILAHGIGND